MLEELYEAYEERMPPATLKAFMEEEAASIPRERLGIDENYEDYNPATRHLAVEWKCASCPCSVLEQCAMRGACGALS